MARAHVQHGPGVHGKNTHVITRALVTAIGAPRGEWVGGRGRGKREREGHARRFSEPARLRRREGGEERGRESAERPRPNARARDYARFSVKL